MKIIRSYLNKYELVDLLNFLPRRVKFIRVWQYLSINRCSKGDGKWQVQYGGFTRNHRRLKAAVVSALVELHDGGYVNVEYVISKIKGEDIVPEDAEDLLN